MPYTMQKAACTVRSQSWLAASHTAVQSVQVAQLSDQVTEAWLVPPRRCKGHGMIGIAPDSGNMDRWMQAHYERHGEDAGCMDAVFACSGCSLQTCRAPPSRVRVLAVLRYMRH